MQREGRALVWSGVLGVTRLPNQNDAQVVMCQLRFFELALKWRQRYHATLVSVQLEGHDQQPVQGLIQAGTNNLCAHLIG